jgi:ferritin-like metal-binding protein YciE
MQKNSLRELYIDELRDLYSAENQLIKALPKMAKASTNDQLREAFEEHLEQTKEHASRLEQIFEQLEEKGSGKKCLGIEGLIKEGAETMDEDYSEEIMDAAIIGAAQRVEHYEVAAYGTVKSLATLLGENDHVSLLEQTLEEEKAADEKLTQISEEVNPMAVKAANRAPAATPGRENSKSKKVA